MNIMKCQCGAITVEDEECTFSNSMTLATFRREFPELSAPRTATLYACNHCINHWGIDLCGCGSGQPAGECDGDFTECRNHEAAQVKGEMKPSFGWR